MRNELVFKANDAVACRFQLCTTVFATFRKTHAPNTNISESINKAMDFCSTMTHQPVQEHAPLAAAATIGA